MFTVEKNKPIPAQMKRTLGFSPFLRTLKIGDSFLCEDKYQTRLYSCSKRLKMKFASKKEGDGQIRIWRIE